jgi:hypothetical protein
VRCRVCIGGSRLVAAFGPRRPARRAALPALAQAVAADRTRSLLPTRPALPPPMRSVCCGASPNPSPCGWLTAASLVHPLSNTRAAAGCVQSPSHQTQPADLRERERWGGHRLVILDSVARIGFDTIGGDGTGGGDDDGQGVVDGSPFSGKGFMQKAAARAVFAGAKALRTVLTRRYNGDVKEAAWSLPMETTVEVMRGVLPQVLDGRLIQLYNEGDEATRAEVTPNPNPRPDTFEHTAARKLRIVALGLARGDRECSLNDGQRPHVRGIRVHVSSTGLHSWRGQLGGRRETAT